MLRPHCICFRRLLIATFESSLSFSPSFAFVVCCTFPSVLTALPSALTLLIPFLRSASSNDYDDDEEGWVGTPGFEYGGYTIEEYERIFAYKKEGTMTNIEEVEESKRKGIIKQLTQKMVYDAAHAVCPFKIGSKVLLHSSRQLTRMAEQLEENFTGPYIIHRLTKANTAYPTKMDGTVLKKTVSCA
uniref:Uncharacterized protein n=1 Tax=Plectus sambesii TaxID=2011161 RepID=A0A914X3C8_9BILA